MGASSDQTASICCMEDVERSTVASSALRRSAPSGDRSCSMGVGVTLAKMADVKVQESFARANRKVQDFVQGAAVQAWWHVGGLDARPRRLKVVRWR